MIDETFRIARLELERDIANYRVRFFAAVAVVTGIAITLGTLLEGDAPVIVPFYFGGAVVIAIGIRSALRRMGPTPALTYLSIVTDMVATSAIFPLLIVLEREGSFEGMMFTPWLAMGPALLLVFLHSMRGDRHTLVFSTVLAAAVLAILVVVSMAPDCQDLVVDGQTICVGVPRAGYLALGPDELFPLVFMTVSFVGLFGILGRFSQLHARQQLKIQARLLRYVPDAVGEQVRTESTDGSIRAPGKLVEVTLLSSDLRGFTALSEKLKPQEVVDQLNAYHDAMCREIERHGGMLDKLIGDGALAIFGWRAPAGDAGAREAVDCARAMAARLETLNRERAARSQAPLAMGIGVHTGWCVAGNIGAGKKLSFTYIGDAVNAASRIEGLTKELGAPILASEETVSRLDSRVGIRTIGPVSVRGRTEAMTLHAVE